MRLDEHRGNRERPPGELRYARPDSPVGESAPALASLAIGLTGLVFPPLGSLALPLGLYALDRARRDARWQADVRVATIGTILGAVEMLAMTLCILVGLL